MDISNLTIAQCREIAAMSNDTNFVHDKPSINEQIVFGALVYLLVVFFICLALPKK